MDIDHNDNGYRGPEYDSEEIDFAEELAQDGWSLVRAPWHGREDDPLVGVALDADPVARLLLDTVGVWPGDRSRSFEYFRDATPWITSVAEIRELLCKGKTGDRLRAEGCPATAGEVGARLLRVIPSLRAAPHPFWDVAHSERCWERHVRDRRFSKAYEEAVLHAELWRNPFWGEQLFAFVALDRSDRRVPREAIERAVFRHIAFPDGFEPVVEDPGSLDRF